MRADVDFHQPRATQCRPPHPPDPFDWSDRQWEVNRGGEAGRQIQAGQRWALVTNLI